MEKLSIFILKRINMRFNNETLKGKKFGMLTCVEFHHRDKKWYPHFVWKCDCGKEIIHCAYPIVHGKKASCCCDRYKFHGNHQGWTGYKEIFGTYWSSIKAGAKKRKLEMSISIEDAWNRFLEQNRCCALTGELIHFQTGRYTKDATASLDRIDSTKGYTKDNIQWLHRKVNYMKQEFSQQEFIEWCEKVVKHSRFASYNR